MKKILKIVGILCFLCGAIITPIKAQEAFVINDLYINMEVAEDGTYTVEERYTLDFSSYRHGFFRTIPTKYNMQWTDSETGKVEDRKYYFPIDQVSCGTTMCETEFDSEGVVVKIGDPDKTVIGKQEYVIKYRIHTKDLAYKDKQMLYWNLVGNSFDTTIENMTYTIQMPKAFDATQINTYTGKYLSAYQNLSYSVNDNTIQGVLLKPLQNYESATIMVNLPNDYFSFPPIPNYLLYAIIGSVFILVVSLLLFYRFGKNDDVVVTVEFKAPDGLDSAAVGYVVDTITDNKDILSLLMDWANRGYIRIYDNEDHMMKLEKIKDLGEEAKPYELTFFQAIFEKKDLVDEADLKDAQIGKSLTQSKTQLSKYFQTKKRRIFTSKSIGLQFFMCVMIALPTIFCTFAANYMYYGMLEMTFSSFLLGALVGCASLPWILLMRKRYVLKRLHYVMLWALCFFITTTILTVSAVFIVIWGQETAWIYALLYLAIEFALLFIMMFMDKRTDIGNRWLGQILGLKEFILSCEKERLELLVQENPTAFFDVLPYAYVLGVSDVWAKKFENIIIPVPEWYQSDMYYGTGFSTWIWWSYFHHSFHNVSQAASYTEIKTSSGSGGSSFGGFSGGGFSGGGFGGGGGGSW